MMSAIAATPGDVVTPYASLSRATASAVIGGVGASQDDQSRSVTSDSVGVPIPTDGLAGITSIDNLMFTSSGYLTTDSGQPITGYAASRNANGTYTPDVAGGMGKPIVVPPGSSNVTIGAGGSVSYETSSGMRVTAGYISLGAFALSKSAGGQADGSPAGASAPANATSDQNAVDTFAPMIGELAQPSKGTAYNHHATYVDLAAAKHGSQVDVRA